MDQNYLDAETKVIDEQTATEHAPSVEDMTTTLAAALEQRPIEQWTNEEVRAVAKQLERAVQKIPDQEKLQMQLQEQMQQVQEQMERRGLVQETSDFDTQLANEWMKAVAGDGITFESKPDIKQVQLQETSDGKQVILMPAKPTLADVLKAAQLLGGIESLDIKKATEGRMSSYAKELKDATYLLAKQRTDAGEVVFDDGVLMYLYNYAQQLDAMAKGLPAPEQKSGETIRYEAEQAELLPVMSVDQKSSSHDRLQAQEVYEKKLFFFLLGKEDRRARTQEGEKEAFYYQRFSNRRKNRPGLTVGEFDEELWAGKDRTIRALARILNREYGKTGNLLWTTREALRGQTKEKAAETLYEAISKKTAEKQKELLSELNLEEIIGHSDSDLLAEISTELHAHNGIVNLIEEAKSRKDIAEREGKPLDTQLAELNDLVLRAYGLDTIRDINPNYFPKEALQRGEFGCSIQALIMKHTLQEVYGDRFILAGDTFVTESNTGHIRLIAIDKEALARGETKAYAIDTLVEEGDNKRYSQIDSLDELDTALTKEIVKAQQEDPFDFHVRWKVAPGDFVTDPHHSIGNADRVIESAIWNNMAATVKSSPDGSSLPQQQGTRQQRLYRVERSLALDPYNPMAWVQLASLYPEESAQRSAFIEKAKALDIHVEDLLDTVEGYTIDAYPYTGSDPWIAARVRDLNDRVSHLPADPNLPAPDIEALDAGYLQNLKEYIKERRENLATVGAPTIELDQFAEDIDKAFQLSLQRHQELQRLVPQFSQLTQEDLAVLQEDPMDWLNSRFDNLYTLLEPGQELSSPQLNTLESLFGNAAQFVANKFQDTAPDTVKKFSKVHQLRLGALVMRTHVNNRDIQQVVNAAKNIGIGGIFEGFGLDDRRVGMMYNRLAIALDTERLATGGKEHHLNPEVAVRISDQIIDEELQLALKAVPKVEREVQQLLRGAKIQPEGIGPFGKRLVEIIKAIDDPREILHKRYQRWIDDEISKMQRDEWYRRDPNNKNIPIPPRMQQDWERRAREAAIKQSMRQTITRSVRFANDLLTCSQRDAVIASRGKALKENTAYRSDVTGINAYNLEQFLIGKFGLFNHEEEEFFDEVKVELAKNQLLYKGNVTAYEGRNNLSKKEIDAISREDLIAIGTELFKDLFAVPDLFSSGWRIEGFLQALEERIGSQAENLGLFLKLKLKTDNATREVLWEKIGNYYPEEIARILREKEPNNRAFRDCFEDNLFALRDAAGNVIPDSANGIERLEKRYDSFRQRFDTAIQMLRAELMTKDNGFQQLDLANLTAEQMQQVDQAMYQGAGAQLRAMYQRMQQQLNTKAMRDHLILDVKFKDVYTRVIRVDDVPFDLLQDTSGGHASLSSLLASQPGHDALMRAWNDTNTAQEAAQELIKFLTDGPMGDKGLEHKIEAGEKFAGKVEGYNGVNAAAEMVRATIGTLLLKSEKNYLLDAIGIERLPFNLPNNKLQEIFGPGAVIKRRREIRALMYALREKLVKNGTHSKEEADEIVNQLMERLGVTTGDAVRMQVIALIVILLVAALSAARDVVNPKELLSGK